MFSTTIVKIVCIRPTPNFELFPTGTWDFFDILRTPPPFGLFFKFPRFLVWKASLMLYTKFQSRTLPGTCQKGFCEWVGWGAVGVILF